MFKINDIVSVVYDDMTFDDCCPHCGRCEEVVPAIGELGYIQDAYDDDDLYVQWFRKIGKLGDNEALYDFEEWSGLKKVGKIVYNEKKGWTATIDESVLNVDTDTPYFERRFELISWIKAQILLD